MVPYCNIRVYVLAAAITVQSLLILFFHLLGHHLPHHNDIAKVLLHVKQYHPAPRIQQRSNRVFYLVLMIGNLVRIA